MTCSSDYGRLAHNQESPSDVLLLNMVAVAAGRPVGSRSGIGT